MKISVALTCIFATYASGMSLRGFTGGHSHSIKKKKFFVTSGNGAGIGSRDMSEYVRSQEEYDFEFKDMSCHLSQLRGGRKRIKCRNSRTHAIHIFPDSDEKWFDQLRHRNQFIVKY